MQTRVCIVVHVPRRGSFYDFDSVLMTKNFESIEAIEKDFSRRTLQSTFIDSEEAEVFDDKLSANKYEKLEEKTPNKKRRIGKTTRT